LSWRENSAGFWRRPIEKYHLPDGTSLEESRRSVMGAWDGRLCSGEAKAFARLIFCKFHFFS
jgi:hypothetical protein